MWLLRNDDKGLIFRIIPGKQNVVSRKEGDLLLLGDQSISRKHAELLVDSENENGGIIVKDLGSKYGTFIVSDDGDLTRMAPNQQEALDNGGRVRFGIQWNTWRVEFFPLVVVTSTLTAGEKTDVKQMVAALGGQVVNDWQPCCTHLTMNKITVTVKVVCALASGRPIVNPGYWTRLTEALSSTQTVLPDCKDFVPPLAEAMLNPAAVSFMPNPARSTLFVGYTFVAASAKQLSRIKPMITAAGGNAVEFSSNSWSERKLSDEKTVLMLHSASDKQGSQQSQVSEGYIPVARKLKAAGIRCVPEAEIGLSIVYCSMAQYCNPRFSHQSLFGSSSSEHTQQVRVICTNTQDSTSEENGVQSGPMSSKKRTLDSSDEEQHASKRNKENSEDLFGSQNVDCNKTDRNLNKVSLTLKKTVSTSSPKDIPKEKPPVVNPSLDMFAPSGQSSSGKNKSPLKKATSKNIPKENPAVGPSLDMFAPSGLVSNEHKRNEIRPSCQDLFVSSTSGQTEDSNRNICNEPASVSNKKSELPQVNDVSFASSKVLNKREVIESRGGDEFSFVSEKRRNNQEEGAPLEEDDFSFVPKKNSKKRTRQSNPDIFASSAEACSTSSDNSRGCTSKTMKIKERKSTFNDDQENDDFFAFARSPVAKRKKENETVSNMDEPDTEVRVALLSKKDICNVGSEGLQIASEPAVIDDPPDEKNLVTYSKAKPHPVKVKEEVVDEEVDTLAKELQNATIVLVKPLVVAKPKPPQNQPASAGKNFKKFRKVVGMNKRIVPHIIGGSDLVPHYANCQNIDDVLPPSPPHESMDDDWGFPNEKKKGKNRY